MHRTFRCLASRAFVTFTTAMPIHEQLKKILVCPVCHGAVRETEADTELECAGCGRRYPVRDGIPVMIPEEATQPANGSSHTA